MQKVLITVGLGIIIALVVIYLLRPLNTSAVGIVVIFCMGVADAIRRLAAWLWHRRAKP